MTLWAKKQTEGRDLGRALLSTSLALAAAAVLGLTAAASAAPTSSAMATPRQLSPVGTRAAWALPTFAWSRVSGADHYEFQLAADAQFNSPVLAGVGHFTTANTRASIAATVPDGRYWWRVRAVSKHGAVSGWSVGSTVKRWGAVTQLLTPANDATIRYPREPLVLTWQPLAGAAQYSVELATEPSFTTLVGRRAIVTNSTNLTPAAALAAGTYYWRVTPLDAERHPGQPSQPRSFHWIWPTDTTLQVKDLVAAPEFDDLQLSWTAVPGAARYELDVNFSRDFAPGSRICCSKPTIATSYSPPKLLDNNTYYWRVRAIDVHGNQGDWWPPRGQLASFTKTFDNLAGSSIAGLRLRDNDGRELAAGSSTSSPVLAWQPVTGASSYEVNVVPSSGGGCLWTAGPPKAWDVVTGIPYWTPLGFAPTKSRREPYPATGTRVGTDSSDLAAGMAYCARVRAIGDSGSNGRVYGDFTYLQPAFTFAGYPTGGVGTTIGGGDYHQVDTHMTPLFTWHAIPGATSYWVLVSRDPSFTTLVDYAYTRVPAFAPRGTYADETTSYYWAVLPSNVPSGSTAVGDPHLASPASFNKNSDPPRPLAPASGTTIGAEQPTFQWAPALGARNYHLQVSSDPKFLTGVLDDVTTDSTAFTSDTTFPPGKMLYWRVQANDENKIALTWSEAQSFEHRLPAPVPVGGDRRVDGMPLLRWQPLPGAVSYDVHLTSASGWARDFDQISSPAFVPSGLQGLGVLHWSVRGEFPTAAGTTPGPYSQTVGFTRTLRPPRGERALVGSGGAVFVWAPKPGAHSYRIDVAANPAFSPLLDSREVEPAAFTPTLSRRDYGGKVYWRVAAIDADRNVGNFSKTFVANLPRARR